MFDSFKGSSTWIKFSTVGNFFKQKLCQVPHIYSELVNLVINNFFFDPNLPKTKNIKEFSVNETRDEKKNLTHEVVKTGKVYLNI